MGEGAETASWAPLSLMAEALAEEVGMIEKFCSTVAKPATIPFRTHALIIELLVAGLGDVGIPTFGGVHHSSPVPLTVVEGAAAMVM
jgi:hypothetical protein